jgi:hypothetical protein
VVQQDDALNPSAGATCSFQQHDAKMLLCYDDVFLMFEACYHIFEAAACQKNDGISNSKFIILLLYNEISKNKVSHETASSDHGFYFITGKCRSSASSESHNKTLYTCHITITISLKMAGLLKTWSNVKETGVDMMQCFQ